MLTRQRRAAFTLLEVLLVVAILVMLAALIVPQIIGQQEVAQENLTRVRMENIKRALEIYKLQNKTYPTTDQGLKALVEKPTEEPVPTGWKVAYCKPEDLNDEWGRPFKYACPGEHNTSSYDLWSDGKNAEDESDNIANYALEGEETAPAGGTTGGTTGGGTTGGGTTGGGGTR